MRKYLSGAACAVLMLAVPAGANALTFDDFVTPDVIFGSGNDNGAFTIDRNAGVELGLRGKLRFNESGLPENTFNSNGDGTYSFEAGQAVGGFSFAQPPTTTPVWSFEWSINTDFNNSSGFVLGDLTYLMGIDFDPGLGTNFLMFDPIHDTGVAGFFDHATGTNSTTSATKQIATDEDSYNAILSGNIVAQNSWNMEFFNDAPFDIFDPTVDGQYTIFLAAFDNQLQTGPDQQNGTIGQQPIAFTQIQIIVGDGAPVPVPEPGPLSLLGAGLIGLAVAYRRRRKA